MSRLLPTAVAVIASLGVGVLLFHQTWWAALLSPLDNVLTHRHQGQLVGVVQLVGCAALIGATVRDRITAFSLLSFVTYQCLLAMDIWRYNQLNPQDHLNYTLATFAGEIAAAVLFVCLSWCWWRYVFYGRGGNAA